jgi:hypothetical protein
VTKKRQVGKPVRQGREMSAAQIAFDMEVGEAFEYQAKTERLLDS